MEICLPEYITRIISTVTAPKYVPHIMKTKTQSVKKKKNFLICNIFFNSKNSILKYVKAKYQPHKYMNT